LAVAVAPFPKTKEPVKVEPFADLPITVLLEPVPLALEPIKTLSVCAPVVAPASNPIPTFDLL
jgi:hypothetical protein